MIATYRNVKLPIFFKTGDLLQVYVLQSVKRKIKQFIRRLRRPFFKRQMRGRSRTWRIKFSVVRLYKFWRLIPLFGRVVFVHSILPQGVVIGLYTKLKRQGVLGIFLLNSLNVVGVFRLKKTHIVRRKFLRFLFLRRKKKQNLVFPLRRVRRPKHKVK